jgi:hypothetical protein
MTTQQKAAAEMMRAWKENVPWRGTFLHDPRKNDDPANLVIISDPVVLATLAAKVNGARIRRGLAMNRLARLARVGEGTIGLLIHGRKGRVSLGVVERLAKALGMSVEELTRE